MGRYFVPVMLSFLFHAVLVVPWSDVNGPMLPVKTGKTAVRISFSQAASKPLHDPEEVALTVRPALESEIVKSKTVKSRNSSEEKQVVQKKENPSDSSNAPTGVITSVVINGLVKPDYPESSRKRGHEGRVVYEIKVGSSGELVNVSLLQSSGHSRLDESGLHAIEAARFEPAKRGKSPVVATKKIAFTFILNG